MNNQKNIRNVLSSEINQVSLSLTSNNSQKEYFIDIDSLTIEMQIKTIEMLALIKGTSPQEAYDMEKNSYHNNTYNNKADDDIESYECFYDDDEYFDPIYDSDNEDIIEYLSDNKEDDEEIFGMEL